METNPIVFGVESLSNWGAGVYLEINGQSYWAKARPIVVFGWWRVKAAWGVLTGKYDAVEWMDQ